MIPKPCNRGYAFAIGIMVILASLIGRPSGAQEMKIDVLLQPHPTLDETESIQVIHDSVTESEKLLTTNEAGQLELGPFDFTADAWVVGSALAKNHGFNFSFEEQTAAAEGNTYSTVDALPRKFLSRGISFADLPHQDISQDTRYQSLEEQDIPGQRSEYVSALKSSRTALSNEDPLHGYIDMNLGRIALLEGNYGKALEFLKPVADGTVAATPVHRTMAMWRVAWLHHQHFGDRRQAYRMWREILATTDNERTQARAAKATAGLLFEIAKDKGIGKLSEARRFIQEWLPMLKQEYSKEIAVMKLMFAESYYYEEHYAEFLNVADQYAGDLQGHPVQFATLQCFKGLALYEEGNYQEAVQTLDDITAMELPDGNHWKAIPDLKAHALRWLISLAQQEGDTELEEKYSQELNSYLDSQ